MGRESNLFKIITVHKCLLSGSLIREGNGQTTYPRGRSGRVVVVGLAARKSETSFFNSNRKLDLEVVLKVAFGQLISSNFACALKVTASFVNRPEVMADSHGITALSTTRTGHLKISPRRLDS